MVRGWVGMMVVVVLASTGCPSDDGSMDEGAGSTASPTTTGASGTDGGMTTGGATSVGSGTMSGTGSTGAPGDDTTTGPVVCAETMCDPGQVCVHPCGGGAQPPCQPQEPDGTCPAGYEPDLAGQCPDPCEGGACCAPEPEDLTPFCLGVDELTCVGTVCDGPNCIAGELQDGQLECGCPP